MFEESHYFKTAVPLSPVSEKTATETTNQELLGHVQIDTTEIYAHLHDQEVMDAMLEHPLSQYKMANAEAFCA